MAIASIGNKSIDLQPNEAMDPLDRLIANTIYIVDDEIFASTLMSDTPKLGKIWPGNRTLFHQLVLSSAPASWIQVTLCAFDFFERELGKSKGFTRDDCIVCWG